MDTTKFHMLLSFVDDLNCQQDRVLRQFMAAKAKKKEVSRMLETPMEELHCPHCGGEQLVRWGTKSDLQRYRCKSCKRTFNSLTGTPLARLKRKGHWLNYAQCLKEGISIRKAAEKCGVHPNTSFRWRHRFLNLSASIKAPLLTGIVEGNELFLVRSEKGNRKLNRPARKRGRDKNKSCFKRENVCVFFGRDRNTNLFDILLDKFNSKILATLLPKHISSDALFCSKNSRVYSSVTREFGIRHGRLNISKGEIVKKDIVHIRNVNAYQGQLKAWIYNHFRGVATKYLTNYLGWFRELDEFNHQISPQTLLLRAKAGGVYKYQYIKVT